MPTVVLFYASYAGLWVLVLFHTLVLLGLVHQQRAEGQLALGLVTQGVGNGLLPIGTPAPVFTAPEVHTGRGIDSTTWRGRVTILVFVSSTCVHCQRVADELAQLNRSLDAQLILLCRGDAMLCSEFVTAHFPGILALLDGDGAIGKQFMVEGTPTVVVLDGDGRILRYGFPHADPADPARPRLGLAELVVPSEEDSVPTS